MHIHTLPSLPLHAGRRQRFLPLSRHAHISFIRVRAAPRHMRDAGWQTLYERVKRVWRIVPFVPPTLTPELISHFLIVGSATGPDAAHRHFPTCMPKETSHEAGTGTGWCGLGTVVQDRGRRGVTCLYAFGEVILTSRKCRVCTYCKLDLSLSVPASWWSTNAL